MDTSNILRVYFYMAVTKNCVQELYVWTSDQNLNLALPKDGESKDDETETSCWGWSGWSSSGQFFPVHSCSGRQAAAGFSSGRAKVSVAQCQKPRGHELRAGCCHHRDGSLLLNMADEKAF